MLEGENEEEQKKAAERARLKGNDFTNRKVQETGLEALNELLKLDVASCMKQFKVVAFL